MEGMLQMLESIFPLPEEARYAILEKTKYRELSKKATLLKAGHICQHIYFIQKGLLRCFFFMAWTYWSAIKGFNPLRERRGLRFLPDELGNDSSMKVATSTELTAGISGNSRI